MAAITPTNLTHATPVTFPTSPGVAADTGDGNQVPNGGATMLVMNNTAGVSATVTVETTATVDGLPVEDRVFTVPATTIQVVKLGPIPYYGTTVQVEASATTVKLAAYAL